VLPVSRTPNETTSMIPRRLKLGFSSLPNKEGKLQLVTRKMIQSIAKEHEKTIVETSNR
jgi:hypothetical protein